MQTNSFQTGCKNSLLLLVRSSKGRCRYSLLSHFLLGIRLWHRVLLGKPEGGNHLEDPGVDGKIISKWILEKWDGGGGRTDWIDPAQDRHRWLALVNAVMNLQVPQNAGNFLTS